MKCLTLYQPWATLIVIGAKQFETRSWTTKHRGILAIHASRKFPYEAQTLCEQEPFKSILQKAGYPHWNTLPLGMILGTVEVVDVHGTNRCKLNTSDPELINLTEQEACFGNFMPGRFAWKITNPIKLPSPIRQKGSIGVFSVDDSLFSLRQSPETPGTPSSSNQTLHSRPTMPNPPLQNQ